MTDEVLHPIDIVNRAMARFGGAPLMSLEEDEELGAAAQMIYDTEVEAALGKMAWRFAQRSYALSRLSEAPAYGWRYAYELPATFLGSPEGLFHDARCRQLLRDFEVEGGRVLCDAEAVFARGTVMVEPQRWPPEFRKAMIVAIAAALCVPVTHDTTLAGALRQEAFGDPREGGAGGLMGRAIAGEVAASPPIVDMGSDNPLTNARWG